MAETFKLTCSETDGRVDYLVIHGPSDLTHDDAIESVRVLAREGNTLAVRALPYMTCPIYAPHLPAGTLLYVDGEQ